MDNSMDGPPTYQSAISHDAMVQHEGDAGKADVKADTKGGDDNGIASGIATGAGTSSSQLHAPAGARIIDARYDGDDGEYRRRDDETWPRDDSVQPICAVYGLYINNDDILSEPHTIKLTDYDGGVLWHFLFPLCPWRNYLVLGVLVANKATTWMVPGDQKVDNPRKGKKGSGHPWTRRAEPPTPAEYTWRLSRDVKSSTLRLLQCADGRTSQYYVDIVREEHQVFAGQKECTRRDYFEFTVPGTDRIFVWLCGGILRNNRYTRWDRIDYVLHEKGDFSTQYGHTKWEPAFGLYLRRGLPEELDHALIVFALVNLMLMQHSMCQNFWQQPYIFWGGPDANQHVFNVPMLQRQAAEYGLRRQE